MQVMAVKSIHDVDVDHRVTMARIAKRRSVCPVACALDLIGDRWTMLVVRDLFCGKSQFKDFLASPEGVATNILSDRLARLERHGLVKRAPSLVGKDLYQLTRKGRTLEPLLQQIADWGLNQLKGTRARMRAP
jgi:DNA-binding HxlR family transcriptional regulator